ncbi:hypothetical protein AAVH_08474 [Aphelenchoides avenae]|nr:hypothetical protein AAVH_08474 [Aphelenchus avenae]
MAYGITDFSCMPVDKPRMVQFARLYGGSVGALERRFNKNIDSIDGKVYAVISALERYYTRYVTNMGISNHKKALAREPSRDA